MTLKLPISKLNTSPKLHSDDKIYAIEIPNTIFGDPYSESVKVHYHCGEGDSIVQNKPLL